MWLCFFRNRIHLFIHHSFIQQQRLGVYHPPSMVLSHQDAQNKRKGFLPWRNSESKVSSPWGHWVWGLALALTFWTYASFPRRNLSLLLMQIINIWQIPVLKQTFSLKFSWSFLSLSETLYDRHFAWSFHSSPEVLSAHWRWYMRAFGPTEPLLLLLWNLRQVCFLLGPLSGWPRLDYESSKSPIHLRAHLWQMKMGASRECSAVSLLSQSSLAELSEGWLGSNPARPQRAPGSHASQPCLLLCLLSGGEGRARCAARCREGKWASGAAHTCDVVIPAGHPAKSCMCSSAGDGKNLYGPTGPSTGGDNQTSSWTFYETIVLDSSKNLMTKKIL